MLNNRGWIRGSHISLLLMVLLFLFISIAYTIGQSGENFSRFPLLESDAAAISSMAAAQEHPELFTNDPYLGDSHNYSTYSLLHVPLIRFLGRISGDYGYAFNLLLIPTIFLHLLGYFLLGAVIFKDRFLSLLFSLLLVFVVDIGFDFWGLYGDITPRILFQAVLPFVLIAIIKWGNQLKNWPWLLGITSTLIYVHPISFVPWVFGIVITLWLMTPDIPWKMKLNKLIISALVPVIVVLPFIFNYLSASFLGSQTDIDFQFLMEVVRERLDIRLIDLSLGYKDFVKTVILSNWLSVISWVFVFLGGLITYYCHRKKSKSWIGMIIGIWWVCIFIAGVLIPIIDHSAAAVLKRMPFQIELIRNLRYLIPLLLLSLFFIFSETIIWLRGNVSTHLNLYKGMTYSLALIFSILWFLYHYPVENTPFRNAFECWTSGQFTCPSSIEVDDSIEMLDYLKNETPIGSRIYTQRESMQAIRYYSLRVLSFAYKDGTSFIYSNYPALLTWWKQYNDLWWIDHEPNRRHQMDALLNFALQNDTDYILLSESFDPSQYYPTEFIHEVSNNSYTLFSIQSP